MKLSRLEKRLGYTFQDVLLLERALTHRSWAYENFSEGGEGQIQAADNETFEFIGDSVLGLAIAEQLFQNLSDEITSGLQRLPNTRGAAVIGGRLPIALG